MDEWSEDDVYTVKVWCDGASRCRDLLQSDYCWRTAMSYGKHSVPTWLGSQLSAWISTPWDLSNVHPQQEMPIEVDDILALWEAAGHPWQKPDNWISPAVSKEDD